jgi:hypothetical protein
MNVYLKLLYSDQSKMGTILVYESFPFYFDQKIPKWNFGKALP